MSHTIKARKLSDYAPLNEAQLAALKAFAKDEGRRWKTILNEVYWYNARIWRNPKEPQSQDGYILHGLRNTHGPSWLVVFKLPKTDAETGHLMPVPWAGIPWLMMAALQYLSSVLQRGATWRAF